MRNGVGVYKNRSVNLTDDKLWRIFDKQVITDRSTLYCHVFVIQSTQFLIVWCFCFQTNQPRLFVRPCPSCYVPLQVNSELLSTWMDDNESMVSHGENTTYNNNNNNNNNNNSSSSSNNNTIIIILLTMFNKVYRLWWSESESECKCLTCNQKPSGSQFSLLHEPN